MEDFLPGILSTPRMFLYAFDEEWAPEVRDFLMRNREYFQSREPRHNQEYYALEGIAARMRAARAQMRAGGGVTYYGCLRTRPGHIVLNAMLSTGEIEGARFGCLGYRMDQAHTGQGLMTEGLERLLALGFQMLQYDYIEVLIARDNPASARVVQKLGFVRMDGPKTEFEINGAGAPHARYRRYPQGVQSL